MRRVAAAFAVLAIAGSLVLAVHAQSSVLIRGRVVTADTGDPLPHARVVIYNDATPLPAIFSDGQGQFSSAPLPQGRYRLTANKPGYAPTSVARLSPDGVDVRMPRSAAIAGRVFDRFGEPAANIQMQLFVQGPDRTKLGALHKRTTTDDLGEYRFGGLAEGTYVVSAAGLQPDARGGFDRVPVYYPGVAAIGDAQNIDLHPGDEKLGVDFSGLGNQANDVTVSNQIIGPGAIVFLGPNGQSMRPTTVNGTGVIRGRVTRADGLPVVHATVSTQVRQTLQGQQINGGGRHRPMTTAVMSSPICRRASTA